MTKPVPHMSLPPGALLAAWQVATVGTPQHLSRQLFIVAAVPLQSAVLFEVLSTKPSAAHVQPPAFVMQAIVWSLTTVALSAAADTIATWEMSKADTRTKAGAMVEHVGLGAVQAHKLSDP